VAGGAARLNHAVTNDSPDQGADAAMNARSFLKHAAVYGLASMLTQAAGLVLLPLYTRYLTPSDYGILEVLGRIAETAATVLLLGGFRQALLTFYQQAPDESERRQVVSGAFLLAASACVAGIALTLLLIRPLQWFVLGQANQSEWLLLLALFGILLEPFTMLPLAILQSRMQSTRFVLVTLVQFLTLIAVRALLIVWFGWGVAGVLAGTLFTTAGYGILLTLVELRGGAVLPRRETIRSLFFFALPFLPGGLCFFVMQHGDRFFLWKTWGTHEVGIYSLGYKLALAVGTFTLSPLYMVWGARMYAAAETPDAPIIFGRVFTRVLAAFVFVGLGLSIFQDEIVRVIAGADYANASRIIAPVVLAGYFQTAASLMDAAFYIRRRTSLKLRMTLEATAVMLVLYFALIPWFAGMGAALATLGGFAYLAGRTWQTSQRIFPVRYEWRRVASCLTMALGLWTLSRLLPLGGASLVIRGLLLLSWPLLAWQVGLLTHDEKEYTLSNLRSLSALLRPGQRQPKAVHEPRTPAVESLPVASRQSV
jgi:O-antigen/teichoic acid export membrane protein